MDIYDGTDWTEADIEDFTSAMAHGSSIETAAEFLCRAGSIDDVERSERGAAEAKEKTSYADFPPGRTAPEEVRVKLSASLN